MSEAYLQELLEEKDLLDPNTFVHSIRLLEDEVLRVTAKNDENRDYTTAGGSRTEDTPNGDSPSSKKPRYRTYQGAVVTEEIVKLSEKVVVPVKEYPKFNFVGKLLGPRGNTLKRLQAATQTRMSVLGRGSTRDKEKEEELRNSDDSKYEHLKEPLHVLIEVEAPKSDAHARLAAALAEIKKYMVPENDEIRQEQMREMALLNSYEKHPDGSGIAATSVIGRGRGAPAPIIRVGIPPPGAIILNGQQPMAIRGRVPRVIARGRPGIRHIALPRHAAPAPDPYAYDAYDTTYEAAYEGYPETGEAVYYEYQEEYPPSSTSRVESSANKVGRVSPQKHGSRRSYHEASYPY
ncbi:KH domain-containing, RNA-binding, signal transduction-associated protein 2-like isoform X1 [Hydractinia symbiolongicarpus]|uniref:KH domain-containing, RNA-binding, signal transduction-associated protein 2-like isoform X1 n=1 Tax=Hydractinia symbiolongicarpus TaxID=13093 RepID=UPI00254BF2AD|nr:KH domain-containing, RNA-binding, signal transduction-associated protein 2-like isoform X1 [Hydractinia symbiolongicarpus]